MGKRIQMAGHLSVEELEQRYRQAKTGVERSHYQIIWLLAQGKATEAVSALSGYSRSWNYELVWGYNRQGTDSLGDKRQSNRGPPRCEMKSNKRNCGKPCHLPPPMEDCGVSRKWRHG